MMDGSSPPGPLDPCCSSSSEGSGPEPWSWLSVFDADAFEAFRHDLPEKLDHQTHALVGKLMGGFSPISVMGSYLDWGTHLMFSPGKQMQISFKAADKIRRLSGYAQSLAVSSAKDALCIEPLAQDRRFRNEAWQAWPFNLLHQNFLLTQQFWHNVITGVPGVRPQHEALADFLTRQALDTLSPSNAFFLNPEVLQRTAEERGENLVRGMLYFWDDAFRQFSGRRPAGHEAFAVGKNLAVTPGKVVYRNHLIELIQYEPMTEQVKPEPVLILPAWIMKYYILDLSPENSLVRYLTGQGFTVFMVSWRNPGETERDVSFNGYFEDGALAALRAVSKAVPDTDIHLAGYCLGGTLAAVAAAWLAGKGEISLRSLTLLAAQVDFEEAGELSLFISDSQLNFLEDLMAEQGYLDKHQMGGAFQMLRSNDLIWSRGMRQYWLGERRPPNDLMAWNADGTRMPAKMHTEYLRRLYLNNELAHGQFDVKDEGLSLSDIGAPIFAVSTTKDHVAPWRSVYKVHLLTDTDVTFVLTSGGHNAGIVSEPGHEGRTFRVRTTPYDSSYRRPERWENDTEVQPGSWWPAWTTWLTERSGTPVAPRAPKHIDLPDNDLNGIEEAPGSYVFQS